MSSPNERAFDDAMMRLACAHSRRWMGAASPNPAVGAVAVAADGRVLAADAHHKAGEAHGEINVLNRCRADGTLDRIATLYVTLEPCNHHGRTPPCTEAVIAAGIRRVVIGVSDPDPVAAGGIARLRAAGIEVVTGVEATACRQALHAFLHSLRSGEPWITIKRAFTSAGSMIPPAGRTTFTLPASLRLAHLLRRKTDAIVTGSGTILDDNPGFDVRHVADHAGKRRWLAILDRRGRVTSAYRDAAAMRGLDPLIFGDIPKMIADLSSRGVRDILVEAGPSVSQAMIDADAWTMLIDIHARDGTDDRVEVAFNPTVPPPFDPALFHWDQFLPEAA